jgi:hypothetical protein
MADELSLTELAILMMTNDALENSRPDSRVPVVLTSKESYFWAVTLAVALEREEREREALERAGVQDPGGGLSSPIDEDRLVELYRKFLTRTDIFEDEGSGYSAVRRLYQPYRLLETLHEFTNEVARADPDQIADRWSVAYQTLIDKGLIEDPIFVPVGGVLIAAVGFVPYSFTSRTTKGGRVYRKIEAMFWSYERDGNTTNVRFRLWKILRFSPGTCR